MTLEELKELRENAYQFKMVMEDRQLPATYEDRILELIDEKISQLSVTDEDVMEAIERIRVIETNHGLQKDEYQSLDLAITALQQIQKEPCEYCELEPTEKIYAYGMSSKKIPVNYCPNCSRKLR